MGKRIGGSVAITLSVIMLLLSIAGIVLLLIYRQPAIDTTSSLLNQADVALTVAGEQAVRANSLSGDVQILVDETQRTLDAAAQEAAARAQSATTRLETAFVSRFGMQILYAVDTVRAVIDVYIASQELAASINQLPGVNFEPPGSARAEELTRQVNTLETTAVQVNEDITRIAAIPGEAMETANAGLNTLSGTLTDIQSSLTLISIELESTLQQIHRLQENHVWIINLTVSILCLILAWTIFSQVIVMRWAWKLIEAESIEPGQNV